MMEKISMDLQIFKKFLKSQIRCRQVENSQIRKVLELRWYLNMNILKFHRFSSIIFMASSIVISKFANCLNEKKYCRTRSF